MRKFIDRTGETRYMNNGLQATIVEYRGCKDIDVRFENGLITKNKAYFSFGIGSIQCPMMIEYFSDYAKVTNPNVTPNFVFLIDREDVDILGDSHWHKNGGGYAAAYINKETKWFHHAAINAPDEAEVDHINGDRTDNRKANLRICTRLENCRNRGISSRNKSGYKGVSWRKDGNKWQSQITVHGKIIIIGKYEKAEEAAKAYDVAAVKYYGEFARLNNIS